MKRYGSMPLVDILIWTTSLICYRQMRYVTKLYCGKGDLKFLKDYKLDSLYDIVDDELFDNSDIIPQVDPVRFWSTRKIEAMHHQICVLKQPAVYSDTDIIMRQPFNLSGDALMWCPESNNQDRCTIYVPWRNLSKPEGYRMPDYVLQEKSAYNCGIWWFKNPDVFEEYRKEYYGFTIGNPCKIKLHKSRDDVKDLESNNNVWACNAEQRILKAVLSHRNQDVRCITPNKGNGWTKEAVHYFHYRVAWRYIDNDEYAPTPESIPMLNLTVKECMLRIKSYSQELYEFWNAKFPEWVSIDAKQKIWPIQKYL